MTTKNDHDPKPRLFISYRSEDAGSTASRLYAELARQFGANQVFLDHEQIEAGANWPDTLQSEVTSATVMFVLIGDRWLTAHDADTGDRRLNISDDWVRQEIEIALKTETAIVPILVEGAAPLSKRALQTVPTIQPLAEMQALPLRRKDWEGDFARIEERLVDLGFSRESAADFEQKQYEPHVELVLDRVTPYSRIQAGRSIVYGTIMLPNGAAAYGEGLHVQMTLENQSDVDVVITLVDVIIEDYDPHPIQSLEYPALLDSGLRLEVPASTRTNALQLTTLETPGSSVPVTQGRLFLRASKSVESQHTLNFSVVAQAPGIWTVRVQAQFVDAARSSHQRSIHSDTLYIVKN